MTMFANELEILKRWLIDQALPLWSGPGVDRVYGGFIETLSPNGDPIDGPRRARLVARQIYVFAVVSRLGWRGPAAEIVAHGLDYLETYLINPGMVVVPSVDRQGNSLTDRFDLYDQAFVLFGLAAAAHSNEQAERSANLACRLRDRMREDWRHPHGGFEESVPRSLPLKANPHMHMLEAALAWEAVSDDPVWSKMADEIADLCLARFLCGWTGGIREYFDGDWRALENDGLDVIEPGHQSEWAWLLIRWGTARGRTDAIAAARRLAEIAETYGVAAVHRLAINELEPNLEVRSGLMRLWPQTERIKAFLALASIAKDAAERNRNELVVAEAARGLMRYFDHPVPGSWWENFNENGQPLVEPARASSLYHIVCAIMEMDVAFAT